MIAATQLPIAPILAVMAFGVVVAIAGHIVRARWLVITGLVLLFAATAAMFAAYFVANNNDFEGHPPVQGR
jgi:hypothetical protein